MQAGCLINRYFFYFLIFSALCGLESGCGGGGASSFGSDPNDGSVPAAAHVFVLVEENHSYEQIIGNPAMPYTNMVAQQYSLATQYYGNAHNSLLDYFVLTVGETIASDDFYSGTVTQDNVVRALTKAGKTWKVYAESLPHIGYLGPNVFPYGRDHNPFAYLSDVKGSSAQAANIVPFTQLATDIQNGTLPDYAMIVPNLVNDGHDCPVPECNDTQKLTEIDAWVQTNISALINSSAFQNSVLIYTWDESVPEDLANRGGHVPTILIGQSVKRQYKSSTMYQHQSTLKLTMKLLGVNDYPGMAAIAPDMSEFF